MPTTNRSPIPAEFTDTNVGGASSKAQQYAKDFIAKVADRDLADRALARYNALVEAHELTPAACSAVIEWGQKQAKAQPGQRAPRADDPRVEYREVQTDKGTRQVGQMVLSDGTTVLAGSYGVATPGDDWTNDTSFFKLWMQKQGQDYGKGWSLQLYTSDDTGRVKLRVSIEIAMLREIATDPVAAAKLFGHEFKRCGVCGRGLTKDDSRDAGIGPVCAANLGA